jgi:tRNA-specific adenosine deaminase 1
VKAHFLLSMTVERIASHVHAILQVYSSTSFSPPACQYTIAASFFLTSPNDCKVISVATGTKCLPTARLPSRGEAIHDSHAEVLARRGAIRWFLEEIGRCSDGFDLHVSSNKSYQSDWICQSAHCAQYVLRDGVQIHLYVSTVPCTMIECLSCE